MTRAQKTTATMHKVSWAEVRLEVSIKNPELAKVIDSINPGPEHYLYKATYPFGSEILKNGMFFVPTEQGNFLPLTNVEISSEIKKDLDYNLNSNPLCFILKNSTELFIYQDNHIFPFYSLVLEGRIFGAWRILCSKLSQHPTFIWDMTAGARSLFMLPKISEKGKHNKLVKKFGLSMDPPKNHLSQWDVFREISQHPDFGDHWTLEILFFPISWIDKIHNDLSWIPLKMFLFQQAWDGSEGIRNQFMWDLIISMIHKNREIKPDSYISEIAKNLLSLGMENLPGFAPCIDNTAGPIRRLQEIYLDVYKLSDYAPIIMQPQMFALPNSNANFNTRPIYYSLTYPITTKILPRSKNEISKISDIYNIKNLLSKYIEGIISMDLYRSDSIFFDLPKKIQYSFFHTDYQEYRDIHPTTDIPLEDENFKNIPYGGDREFPSNSSFINGCVRLKAKKLNLQNK